MHASDANGQSENDAATDGGKTPKAPKMVEIMVNEQKVEISKGKHTGREVKQVAIAQGAVLELDFVLSVQHGDHYTTVADEDVLNIHAGMDFLAVSGDDNS